MEELKRQPLGSPIRTYLDRASVKMSPSKRLIALRGYLSHHLIAMGSRTTLENVNAQHDPHSIHIHTFLALQQAVLDRCLQLFWIQVVQNRAVEWSFSIGKNGLHFLSVDLKDPAALRKWLALEDSRERIREIKTLNIGMIPFLPPEIRYFTDLVIFTNAPYLFGVWENPPASIGIERQRLECLPPEIGALKMMHHFSVLNGGLDQLPVEMKELTELKSLNLSGNQFREFPLVLCEMGVPKVDLSRNPLDHKTIPKDWLVSVEYV